MIKRYSDIHDENLLTVINNLQNNHDLPFDAFLKVERGNNIDGSSCWRLVLKGKQGFFFWFRADFQNPYVDANPRYDKTFGGLGKVLNSQQKTFTNSLINESSNWLASIQDILPEKIYHRAKINYPEYYSSEDRIVLEKAFKKFGFNRSNDFVRFEHVDNRENEKPWIVFQRVGNKYFFRMKLSSTKVRFNHSPGTGSQEETDNMVEQVYNNAGANSKIDGTRVYPGHISRLEQWLEKLKIREVADRIDAGIEEEEIKVDVEQFTVPFIDLTDDGTPSLTRDEIKEVRDLLKYWKEIADSDLEIDDETKDKFDEVVSTADLIIVQNRQAPKTGIAKVVGGVLKVAKDEGIKIVVKKGLDKVPSWIMEHLPKLLEEYNPFK